MRILMLCPQFRPLTGGYERAAERLSTALVGRGHHVTVATERRDRNWPKCEELSGVHVRRWGCIYRPGLHSLTSLFNLAVWLLLYGRKYHIWHAHQYGAHATVAVLLGMLLRRPVVLKLTSSGSQGLAKTLAALRFSTLHRWAHRRVAACIAVSEETKLEALAFEFPPGQVHSISNGIDTSLYRPLDLDQRDALKRGMLAGAHVVFIAVGRLAAVKNPDGLLRAWADVQQFLPDRARLVWVGDGPMRSQIESTIRSLGLAESVHLVGESESVEKWLGIADVFVLGSHTEGMPNTLIEAMACGLPSLATAVSGTSQLLIKNDAGIVVPIGDMKSLAKGLVRLAWEPELRREMGGRARSVVAVDYSLEAICARVEALYRGLSFER